MDQFISAAAVEDCALKISCDTMEYSPITLPENAAIVVADTKLPRTLAGSAYNQRRAECDEALELIKSNLSDRFNIETMADINVEVVDASQQFLPPTLFQRVRHVATENLRVEDAAKALAAGDLETLGKLFDASHASLRDDYEVSSEGLDRVTSLMRDKEGCFGARLTGAGFGGCAIALVDASIVDQFVNELNDSCELTPKPEFFWSKSVAGGLVFEA
ncbi:UNVERIFIED_CONTAM: hypothetical protein GTU68_053058 [Idotea baltica]|nr:hypothetical protein [Idotea baltica]